MNSHSLMMKMWQYLGVLVVLFELGCNPFDQEQRTAQAFIEQIDTLSAENMEKNTQQLELREIKPYDNYVYRYPLSDPFRVRGFVAEAVAEESVSLEQDTLPPCTSSACRPPSDHPQSMLENYNLESLKFVGVLQNNPRTVALIEVPNYGVVNVRIGDYLGRNNGKIVNIRRDTIVLQEKVWKNGLWENKQTLLKMKR